MKDPRPAHDNGRAALQPDAAFPTAAPWGGGRALPPTILLDRRGPKPHCVVVGAGAAGLNAARAALALGFRVTIIALDTPGKQSEGPNGGLIEPYRSEGVDLTSAFNRSSAFYETYLADWTASLGTARRADMLMIADIDEHGRPVGKPGVLDDAFPAHHNPNPVASPVPGFPVAYRYRPIIVNSEVTLNWLLSDVRRRGAEVLEGRVDSLAQVVRNLQPDVIILATGMAMGQLWTEEDLGMEPVGGLLCPVNLPPPGTDSFYDRLLAPSQYFNGLMHDGPTAYVLPNIVPGYGMQLRIGGTFSIGKFGDVADTEQVEEFIFNVEEYLPAEYATLVHRNIGNLIAGTRPYRAAGPLLKAVEVPGASRTAPPVPVILLGGLGAVGITISPALGADAADMALRLVRAADDADELDVAGALITPPGGLSARPVSSNATVAETDEEELEEEEEEEEEQGEEAEE